MQSDASFATLTLVTGLSMLDVAGRMNVQLAVDVRLAGQSALQDALSVDQLGYAVVLQTHVVRSPRFLPLKQLWVVAHLHNVFTLYIMTKYIEAEHRM